MDKELQMILEEVLKLCIILMDREEYLGYAMKLSRAVSSYQLKVQYKKN